MGGEVVPHRISCAIPSRIGEIDFIDIIKYLNKYLHLSYGYRYQAICNKSGQAYAEQIYYNSRYLKDISRKKKRHFDILDKAPQYMDKGILLDIYEDNLLKKVHLSQKFINGITLKDYISINNSHGSLSRIHDEYYLWKIPKASLGNIRKDIYKEPFVLVGDIMMQKYKDGLI